MKWRIRMNKKYVAFFVFFLFAVFVFASSAPCEAAKWEQTGAVKEGEITITSFVDKESVKSITTFLIGANKRELWEKRVFSPPKVMYQKPVAEMLHFNLYHQNKQYCNKIIRYVYTDGSTLDNTFECKYVPIVPDTLEEGTWKYLFASVKKGPNK
jgi:hypothetical protein